MTPRLYRVCETNDRFIMESVQPIKRTAKLVFVPRCKATGFSSQLTVDEADRMFRTTKEDAIALWEENMRRAIEYTEKKLKRLQIALTSGPEKEPSC